MPIDNPLFILKSEFINDPKVQETKNKSEELSLKLTSSEQKSEELSLKLTSSEQKCKQLKEEIKTLKTEFKNEMVNVVKADESIKDTHDSIHKFEQSCAGTLQDESHGIMIQDVYSLDLEEQGE